jgi:hypothetical protein
LERESSKARRSMSGVHLSQSRFEGEHTNL